MVIGDGAQRREIWGQGTRVLSPRSSEKGPVEGDVKILRLVEQLFEGRF